MYPDKGLTIVHSFKDFYIQIWPQEERAEASDIVTATLENTSWGPTKIATQIKMAYDKSFGAAWQVDLSFFMKLIFIVLKGYCWREL